MMKKIVLILLFFSFNLVTAQESFVLFPDKLNIQPFTANAIEPRLGYFSKINNNELRLDIGNSMDVFHSYISENTTLSFGADLFTYTLLRGEKDFHFPVDAVDYLFGVNMGFKKNLDKGNLGFRFRLSHISAHFVDGHFDPRVSGWRDGKNSRVYSREFIEFFPFYSMGNLRVYGGYTYIFHTDPVTVGKNNFQAGFDYYFKDVISKNVTPYLAGDLKLVKIGSERVNNTFYAGIKIGNQKGKGLNIFYSFYTGKNFHGEYFDSDSRYNAFGFYLDL